MRAGLLLATAAFLLKIGATFSRGSVVVFGLSAVVLLGAQRRTAKRLTQRAMRRGVIQGSPVVVRKSRAAGCNAKRLCSYCPASGLYETGRTTEIS